MDLWTARTERIGAGPYLRRHFADSAAHPKASSSIVRTLSRARMEPLRHLHLEGRSHPRMFCSRPPRRKPRLESGDHPTPRSSHLLSMLQWWGLTRSRFSGAACPRRRQNRWTSRHRLAFSVWGNVSRVCDARRTSRCPSLQCSTAILRRGMGDRSRTTAQARTWA